MKQKSTINGFILLLILQITLITSQEVSDPVLLSTNDTVPISYIPSTYYPTSFSSEISTTKSTAAIESASVVESKLASENSNQEVTTSKSPCDENMSEKLYSWWRNETSLSLFWFSKNTTFTHYIVSIDPPDSIEPIYIIKKNDIKPFDKTNVAFNDLHSSTFYNISVKKAYGAKILSETNKYWATQPAQPFNLYVDQSSITPTSFHIYWDTEKISSGPDYYILSLKINNEVYFYRHLDGNHDNEYEFKDLRSDTNYTVELTTVFNQESSNPAVTNVFLSSNKRNMTNSDIQNNTEIPPRRLD